MSMWVGTYKVLKYIIEIEMFKNNSLIVTGNFTLTIFSSYVKWNS